MPLPLSAKNRPARLDVFPAEYGGSSPPHRGLGDARSATRDCETDLRRACELQAKSHLIHLREGFLEAGGDLNEVVYFIASSSHAFRSLLSNIARLDGELTTPPTTAGTTTRSRSSRNA